MGKRHKKAANQSPRSTGSKEVKTAIARVTGKRKPRGLPTVRVPDLSAQIAVDPYEASMTAQERRFRGLMVMDWADALSHLDTEQVSPEERAMLLARAFCQHLLKTDDEALKLAGCLIATRRMYAV